MIPRSGGLAGYALVVVVGLGGCSETPPGPAAEAPIRFSHALHLKLPGAQCLNCHREILTSTDSADNNLPREEACLACHNPSQPEAGHECALCHPDPQNPRPLENRPRGIRFDHRLHLSFTFLPQLIGDAMADGRYPVDVSELQALVRPEEICTACHRGMERVDLAVPASLPMMWDCLVCHAVPVPEDQCRKCHLPSFDLFPADHREATFFDRHAAHQDDNPLLCAQCHSSARNPCTQCH